MKISFINEVADLCEAVGADVQEVATAIGADGRIGNKFLHPGPGYGGSCFPKDVAALIRTAREERSPLSLIEQVQTVNSERKIAMAGRVERAAGGSLEGKTVAVLGVAFKPDTDDVREAPSLILIPMLQERGAKVRAYDPHGRENAEPLLPGIEWCESALDAADAADVTVVVTEWNEFRALDLDRARALLKAPIMVDLRNIYRPADVAAAGFRYISIGRPAAEPPPRAARASG
jgi:UDPglucose 6-dehydrogenase